MHIYTQSLPSYAGAIAHHNRAMGFLFLQDTSQDTSWDTSRDIVSFLSFPPLNVHPPPPTLLVTILPEAPRSMLWIRIASWSRKA